MTARIPPSLDETDGDAPIMNDDLGTITVCQGPPRCDLVGDEAVAAQGAGCVWCSRITLHSDGSETVLQPVSDIIERRAAE